MAGSLGAWGSVRVHAGAFLRSVASPFYSFVTRQRLAHS